MDEEEVYDYCYCGNENPNHECQECGLEICGECYVLYRENVCEGCFDAIQELDEEE